MTFQGDTEGYRELFLPILQFDPITDCDITVLLPIDDPPPTITFSSNIHPL